ncbi:uncharacterized protein N7459_003925 [Penicillium hispanicum]|uniref:uncharacterized protein n=1 Tax=Penicillium hispanicum TaxID=1080232 RepID=UPI002541FCA5|nr:uncharacterized protein N7459_003925 [Penicillium hispanicum]KAJ5584125.1 hypothetical protein N7459_003925 [Penicillium hispanicum]
MKLYLPALLSLLPLTLAANSLKSVIITFPKGTPSSVILQAKDSLKAAGGVITHEYSLIRGFAAEAPAIALETLSTQSTEYKPEIEEDEVVSAYGHYVGEERSS